MSYLAARPWFGLSIVTAIVAGCGGGPSYQNLSYPSGEFSSSWVDFGEVDFGDSASRSVTLYNTGDLAMGISTIEMGTEETASNFSVDWNAADIECPDSDTGSAAAKGVTVDSGSPGPGPGGGGGGGGDDTGGPGPEDTGDGSPTTETPEDVEMVLDAGCKVPITIEFEPLQGGIVYSSVFVTTARESGSDVVTPSYFSDPIESTKLLYLTGEGLRGLANVVVSPRSHNFGAVWTGIEETAIIEVRNSGDGELNLVAPQTDEDCDSAFSIIESYETGKVLQGEEATFVQVGFTPEDQNTAYCTVTLISDDEDSPSIDVSLQGNAGSDPNNEPPTVEIRAPDVGYMHRTLDPIEMEINVFDVNQPATSLTCKVKSMVLAGASVADCTPEDESGHVFVDIDPDDLGEGVDTLRVTVTDAGEELSSASISVLVSAGYPESDDDGDGFGLEDTADPDCDDEDINSYPYAAEIPDGNDNDCDGVVDEGTSLYDDDGDTVTEEEGDCDDSNDDVYPGAPESPDHADNDCDGTVDETTSFYDDDGDGFTEVDNDCDDADTSVYPGAVEYCDGVDNDCNGLMDSQDGCIEIDSEPYIVGGIDLSQTAWEEGDAVIASVFVHDADGQEVSYAWSGDDGVTIEPASGASTVTVTCPTIDVSSDVEFKSLYVLADDEDGHQVWAFNDLVVYPGSRLYVDYKKAVPSTGCTAAPVTGDSSRAMLAVLGLLGLVATRRRRLL